MDEVLTRYLESYRLTHARETVHNRTYQLEKLLRWCAEKQLDYTRLKQIDVENYMSSLPFSSKYRYDVRCTVRHLYEFLGIVPNPAAKIIIRSSPRNPPKKVPSQVTLERILTNIKNPSAELTLRNRLMVELAYGSGLRRGELCSLTVQDVDLGQACATVTGKGNKTRVVPLTAKSVLLLKEYLSLRKATRGPVLPNIQTGKPLSDRHISKLFRVLTGHNTHAFRHACATHMLANGCNLRHIQALLGHTKISTTEIYTHVDKSQLAKVIETGHPRKCKP